jgi:ketosteroid isomerase-like protein
MKNRFFRPHFDAILILISSQVPARDAGKHAAEMQAIKDSEARWSREFEARDFEKVVAHYADHAVLMAPGFPAMAGKDAIRSAVKAMFADPAMTLKFHTSRIEIGDAGDMASSVGTFTGTSTDPVTRKPVTSGGNYVTVYRKQAGEWKAVFDIASPGPAPDVQSSMPKEKKP